MNWTVTYYNKNNGIINQHIIKDRTEHEAEKEADLDKPNNCDDWTLVLIEPITEVIFRKFKDGEIIAIFPYLTEFKLGDCMSYMHIGQHGVMSLDLIQNTKLAIESEYSELHSELINIGYNLKVQKKVNWNKHRMKYYEYLKSIIN